MLSSFFSPSKPSSSTLAASPSPSSSPSVKIRPCCLAGFITSKEPRGRILKLGGVDAYVAMPPEGASHNGRAIIIATDVFGLNSSNVKVIADAYAEMGNFLVVVPDMFAGTALPAESMELGLFLIGRGVDPTQSNASWMQRMLTSAKAVVTLAPQFAHFLMTHPPANKIALFEAVIRDIKSQYGVSKTGIHGFCYGGFFSLHFASLTDKVDAFVATHTQVRVPQDIESLKKPGLFICADNDWLFPEKDREKAESILVRMRHLVKVDLKFYPGTYHGFAIRGDDRDPKTQSAMQDSFQQSLQCFQEHLKCASY